MPTNLIRVFHFTALCARSCSAAVLLAFSMHASTAGTDCESQPLTAQQKLERFRELDARAQSAMQAKRFAEAVELYHQAVCLAPSSPRALYGLGVAEAASGDFLKARESLHTADALQPTSPLPLVMQVRVNVSLNDIEALKADLRDAQARFSQDAHLHSLLARFLAEKKLVVLALAEALRSQQTGAADLEAKVQLAVLENAVGAYEDAIRNATAVAEKPDVPDRVRASAAGIAGLSYESIGQKDEAIRQLREAIRLDPSRENSYLALADLFEELQNYPEAVKILKQARTNLPNSTALLLPLGADLIRTQQYKDGIDVLRELLRQSPDEAQAYLSIADAYRQMGNSEQEVQALRDLVGRKPNYPMIHVLIARAMLASAHADYAKVLGELAEAERSAPLDPDVFYLRGKVYIAMNRYDDALAALRRSIELRPMETGPYYQLARIYQKLGETKLAAEQFQRVKYLESVPTK
jgi:tetratricopeptide (TPR) repeat protein